MGRFDVLPWSSAVDDDYAGGAFPLQKIFKMGTDVLYCMTINRDVIYRLVRLLDEHSPHHTHSMPLNQVQGFIKEANCVSPFPPAVVTDLFAEVGALYFLPNPIKSPGTDRKGIWVEALLESEKILGDAMDQALVDDKAPDDEGGLGLVVFQAACVP